DLEHGRDRDPKLDEIRVRLEPFRLRLLDVLLHEERRPTRPHRVTSEKALYLLHEGTEQRGLASVIDEGRRNRRGVVAEEGTERWLQSHRVGPGQPPASADLPAVELRRQELYLAR